MKRLIVALLLLVFSVQGMGAATGVNVLNASRVFTQTEMKAAQLDKPSASLKADLGFDDSKILSIAEELSDYVMPDVAPIKFPHRPPTVRTAGWVPISVILPRHLPPPRS